MPPIHFLQQWFELSDPALEEALHAAPPYREFTDPEGPIRRLPEERTTLRFRHLLEEHGLAAPIPVTANRILHERWVTLDIDTMANAALLTSANPPKNSKGNNHYFGIKAHEVAVRDKTESLAHLRSKQPARGNDSLTSSAAGKKSGR